MGGGQGTRVKRFGLAGINYHKLSAGESADGEKSCPILSSVLNAELFPLRHTEGLLMG